MIVSALVITHKDLLNTLLLQSVPRSRLCRQTKTLENVRLMMGRKEVREHFFFFFFKTLLYVSHSLSHLCVHSSVQHDCGCEKEQKQERESLPWSERDSRTLKQNGTVDSGCSWTVTAVV